MILCFDFESEPFRDAIELFNRMEVSEAIYEGAGAPSETK